MRKYGRKAYLRRGGGLLISKRVEYVHDCEKECPNGHMSWNNVWLEATEITAISPLPEGTTN